MLFISVNFLNIFMLKISLIKTNANNLCQRTNNLLHKYKQFATLLLPQIINYNKIYIYNIYYYYNNTWLVTDQNWWCNTGHKKYEIVALYCELL